MPYSPKKAAQIVAYFAINSTGGRLNTLKAVKLVYLADRAAIAEFGFPLQDERRVSMPFGPVNSSTYDYIKGEVPPQFDGGWSDYVTDRRNHNIGLTEQSLSIEDLDELSDAELAVLAKVWEEFGHMTQWELVEWTHDRNNVPEWKDPNGSSRALPLEDIMSAVGCENINETIEEINAVSQASDFLRSL